MRRVEEVVSLEVPEEEEEGTVRELSSQNHPSPTEIAPSPRAMLDRKVASVVALVLLLIGAYLFLSNGQAGTVYSIEVRFQTMTSVKCTEPCPIYSGSTQIVRAKKCRWDNSKGITITTLQTPVAMKSGISLTTTTANS